MRGFRIAFQRLDDGSWLCVQNAEWQSPSGRIQVTEGTRFTPGTAFMGIDLVKLLDDEAAKKP